MKNTYYGILLGILALGFGSSASALSFAPIPENISAEERVKIEAQQKEDERKW